MVSWLGLISPEIMRGISSWRDSTLVTLALPVTCTRTLSQRSPSIRSLPPRPSMMSLPLPPSRILPAEKDVIGAPKASMNSSCKPFIRAMLVSVLPSSPSVGMVVASELSPLRMSPKAEPESPSTSAKRSRRPALEAGTGGSTRSLTSRSTLTPRGSPR
ncbi:hypothetical protein D3C72_1808480 [compost metagenome]